MDPMGNPTTVEGTPQYGIYMLDLNSKTLRPVVLPQNGFYYASPVPLQARPKPAVIGQFTPDATIPAGFGLFDVHTVYDTDDKQRMGDAVLAAGESIPRVAGQPDIASLMTPGTPQYANRVARFFRITKAVPTPSGMNRNALGETEFEMQQIVGYGLVEPDGSIRAHVPADTAINITVLDGNGRQFVEHDSRGTKIRDLKTFREFSADIDQQLPRIILAILLHLQVRKAQRGPELPKQGTLQPCHVERFAKALLGEGQGLLARFLAQQLPLDPQQFGEIPTLIPRLSARKHIVNGRNAVRDLGGVQ